MSKTVELARSRRLLALLWYAGAGLIVLLVIAQTVGNKYGSQVARAWGWLLPSVIPTLSLIVGAVAYQARHRPAGEKVDAFAYQSALGLSLFYFALLFGTLLLQPLSSGTALEWLQTSNLWLGPVQGVTALALAVFFQKGEAK